MKNRFNLFIFISSFQESGQVDVKPLEYGEFLYEGKRTLSTKKQYIPKIEEFPDILERVRFKRILLSFLLVNTIKTS